MEIDALFRESMLVLATVGAPIFLSLLVAGLILGALQAATQINDPAVGALPRIILAAVLGVVLGEWMVERLAGLFAHAVAMMGRPL